MKKTISLLLALVLCLSLCSCGNDPVSKIKDVCKEYNLSNIEVSYKESWSIREYTYYKIDVNCDGASVLDKKQMGLLLDSIKSAGTDWDSNRYVSREDVTINSDGHVYAYMKDEYDREILTIDGDVFLSKEEQAYLEKQKAELDKQKEAVYESDDPVTFVNYLRLFREVVEKGKELKTIDYFPYDKVLNLVTNKFDCVIRENTSDSFYYGYSADENREFWYDPLSKCSVPEGEVGFFYQTYNTTYYGDLMTYFETREWYMTAPSDPNNYYKGKLYYKDKMISSDYIDVKGFIRNLSDGEVYACEDESGEITIVVLLDDSFMIFQDCLFFIYYS